MDGQFMTDQEALDAGQKKLHRIMQGLAKLSKQASEYADQMCKGGDNSNSAALRAMEADLLAAQASATSAYAKGRELNVGGAIARSGDK